MLLQVIVKFAMHFVRIADNVKLNLNFSLSLKMTFRFFFSFFLSTPTRSKPKKEKHYTETNRGRKTPPTILFINASNPIRRVFKEPSLTVIFTFHICTSICFPKDMTNFQLPMVIKKTQNLLQEGNSHYTTIIP
jgi:hypothetical protein